LRVALYRNFEARMDEAHEDLELPPHGSATRTVEGLLGRFVDAAWAYRFGPPAQDAIVLSLETGGEPREPLSQSVRFTAGPPRAREAAAHLGLEAVAGPLTDGLVPIAIDCRRLAYGVRVRAPGFMPLDDAFTVEPGVGRTVQLRAIDGGSAVGDATLTALNLDGVVKVGTAEK
jgi:beta-mannosidase